ncbi:MAG: HD-GYP domain-containing protein [Lachnospiraceae bacterium]|nr:HD-GYP domain-containing protein [Lachnospiraceae bacterium]
MSDVLLLLSMRTIDGSLFGNSELAVLLFSLADFLISMLSYGLFYFLVIRGLSSLTDRELATERRVFILPPALFVLLYATVCFSLFYYLDGAAVLCLSGSTILIEFLFIWAFYIIIRNINATGDALEAKEEVKALSVEVMEALAHTIDAKDEYTKGHSVRVAAYSRMLAERMGLSADECENVYYMGLLHDIGKIGVPNEIINSPTKLTEEEFSVVKMHPGLGFDILSEIKSRPDLAIGARWHHERFDGSGYPDGRAGEEIPLPARIISVADSYDAMTSNRSYRKYLSQEKVKEELKKNEGTQFDPGVVSAMLKIMEEDSEYSLHE